MAQPNVPTTSVSAQSARLANGYTNHPTNYIETMHEGRVHIDPTAHSDEPRLYAAVRSRIQALEDRQSWFSSSIRHINKQLFEKPLEGNKMANGIRQKITVDDVQYLLSEMKAHHLNISSTSPALPTINVNSSQPHSQPPPADETPSSGAVQAIGEINTNEGGVPAHIFNELLVATQKDITETRMELTRLAHRVHFLDDGQNRFAILRQFMRSSLEFHLARGQRHLKSLIGINSRHFLAYTVKTNPGTCTFDTCLAWFRAVLAANESRCQVKPLREILSSDAASQVHSVSLCFPTFADLCDIIHLPKGKRVELAVRSSKPNRHWVHGTTSIVGTEFNSVNSQGTTQRRVLVGRSGIEDLNPADFVPNLIVTYPQEGGALGNPTETFRLQASEDQARSSCFALLDTALSRQFVLRWTRLSSRYITPKSASPLSVTGTICLEIPILFAKGVVVRTDFSNAVGELPGILRALHDSPYDSLMAANPLT